jgi:hypothetical protein
MFRITATFSAIDVLKKSRSEILEMNCETNYSSFSVSRLSMFSDTIFYTLNFHSEIVGFFQATDKVESSSSENPSIRI